MYRETITVIAFLVQYGQEYKFHHAGAGEAVQPAPHSLGRHDAERRQAGTHRHRGGSPKDKECLGRILEFDWLSIQVTVKTKNVASLETSEKEGWCRYRLPLCSIDEPRNPQSTPF